ncbi:MAG: collagen-like triple helix repeat-containing protein [Hydrogenophaga sp.]|uniref:collagen-like triple helix repeat-containing protein n=1 Tax=Hydrogenophaga sp. TaxID=1904254 RepID=UPI0040368692
MKVNIKRKICLSFIIASGSTWSADVSLRAAFQSALSQDVAVVSVADNDILVLDAGSYYSNGRKVIIAAKRARLDGEIRIAFFRDDDHPTTPTTVANQGDMGDAGTRPGGQRHGLAGGPGKTGAPGKTGEPGEPGASIRFDVQELEGDGVVVIVGSGQIGGKGQKAGQGGVGGTGFDGRNRDCGTDRKSPGNGGAGGPGGIGGVGGIGGTGGAGGVVLVSSALKAAMADGKILLDLRGAKGGKGGDGGDKGSGGRGGGMGRGGNCGGGGEGGPAGPVGEDGVTGPGGPAGSSATASLLPVEGDGDAVTTFTERQRTATLRLRPKSSDCEGWHEMMVMDTLPSDAVAVAYQSVVVRSIRGITDIDGVPSIIPMGRELQVRARVKRLLIPSITLGSNLRRELLQVTHSCPAADLEVRYNVLTVPALAKPVAQAKK